MLVRPPLEGHKELEEDCTPDPQGLESGVRADGGESGEGAMRAPTVGPGVGAGMGLASWDRFFFFSVFGSAGSLLLQGPFSSCSEWGLQISYCGGFSCCRAWAPGHTDFKLRHMGSIVEVPGLSMLCSMWNLPGSGIEPMSPALAGGFLCTVPAGKSQDDFL